MLLGKMGVLSPAERGCAAKSHCVGMERNGLTATKQAPLSRGVLRKVLCRQRKFMGSVLTRSKTEEHVIHRTISWNCI